MSLANGKLRKDSFEVFQTNFGEKKYYEKTSVYDEIIKKNILPCKISDFYFFNKPKDEHIIFSNKPLLIFLTDKEAENPIYLDYPYKNAMIILPKNIMTFTKNGWLTKSNSVILSDYWSNEGVSVSLPDDFVLE